MYRRPCSRPECRAAALAEDTDRNKDCIEVHEAERKKPAAERAAWGKEECLFSRTAGITHNNITVLRATPELAQLRAETIVQQGRDAGLYGANPEHNKTGILLAANSTTTCKSIQHGQANAIRYVVHFLVLAGLRPLV